MTDLAELRHKHTRGVFRREDADSSAARTAHKATIVRRSTTLVARDEPVPDVQAALVPLYRVGPTTCSSERAS